MQPLHFHQHLLTMLSKKNMPAGPGSQRSPCKESWEMRTQHRVTALSSLIWERSKYHSHSQADKVKISSFFMQQQNNAFRKEWVLDRITVWICIALDISLSMSLFFTELCYAKCHQNGQYRWSQALQYELLQSALNDSRSLCFRFWRRLSQRSILITGLISELLNI